MKASEIRVGGVYFMKVSGTVQRVRVDAIRNTGSDWHRPGGRSVTIYDCTNLTTGRKCQARSASKFRGEVKPTPGPQTEAIGYRKTADEIVADSGFLHLEDL